MGVVATALYRRYRPETFAEMIGQSQVTEPLMTALRTGRVGHAYLFSGPRGCGKTTSARVLARCLNCEQGPTDTPCGTCPSCVELGREGGGSLDVVEIDAASHGGVDDARDLRERALFSPARDRYKIFIIDEAHMVSPQGFNALLKLVEEPPPHVKFVFATTEPEKVIGTIRSRTHHYPFRLIPPAPLLEYISGLCQEEGVDVEPGVLSLVIRAGGGSARDTLSILDQLIAGSEGNRVTYDRAIGLLGFTHEDLLDEIVVALGQRDAAAGVRTVDKVIQSGQDPRRFVEDLLDRLRDLLIVQATDVSGAEAVLRGIPDEQLQRMYEQSALFTPVALSRVADLVNDALDRMTGATAPRLHLELMVARIYAELADTDASPARSSGVAESQPAPARVKATQPAPEHGTPPSTPAFAPSAPAPAEDTAVTAADAIRGARAFLSRTDAATAPVQQRPPEQEPSVQPGVAAATPPVPEPEPAAPRGLTREIVEDVWPDLINVLGERHERAATTVRKVVVLDATDGNALHLGFGVRELLEDFKVLCAGPVRAFLSERFGVTVTFHPKVSPEYVRADMVTPPPSAPEGRPVPDAKRDSAPPEAALSPERVSGWGTRATEPVRLPAQAPAGPPAQVSTEPPAPASTEPPVPEPATGPGRSAPEITRYGEPVVRDILGGTFVEEQPLPPTEP